MTSHKNPQPDYKIRVKLKKNFIHLRQKYRPLKIKSVPRLLCENVHMYQIFNFAIEPRMRNQRLKYIFFHEENFSRNY